MQDVQRVAAYGVLADGAGHVVLVRGSDRSDVEGVWSLPGGGVDFGEDPRDAVVREVAEETGVAVRGRLRDVLADVLDVPHRDERMHTIRVLYDLEPVAAGGWTTALRPEPDGTSDAVRLLAPDAVEALPLMPFTARVLGLPVPPPPVARPPRRPLDDVTSVPTAPHGLLGPRLDVAEGGAPTAHADLDALHDEALARVQRPAAYALCHADGRLLLTRLRDTDLWTLPGGGIDHGEEPPAAAVREVHEETGLAVRLRGLLDVDSIRFTGRGPSGRAEDFHGVRVVYDGEVPTDVAPRVTEVDGSTEEVAWWPVADLRGLRLTGLVRSALRHLPGPA